MTSDGDYPSGPQSGFPEQWAPLPSETGGDLAPLAPQPPTYPSSAVAVITQESPPPQQPWYRLLAQPIPLWGRLAGIGVIVVGLIALIFTGSDWADGAAHAGIAAGALALLVLLATGARSLVGMAASANPFRFNQYLNTALLAGLLLMTTGAGLGLGSPVHRLQAHVLEGQLVWQQAITQYQRAGETAPNSDDLARVYNEWGERLIASKTLPDALDKFNTVLDVYSGAKGQANRAQHGAINTYLGWGMQAEQAHNYLEATQHFDAALGLTYCDSACQTQVGALDATAYYNLAEIDLLSGSYANAVSAFHTLASRFSSAPEASRIHADLAKALLGLGKQQVSSATCSAALPTYQELVTNFSDTPEGMQGATDMAQPQSVKGQFYAWVTSATPFVILAKGLNGGMTSDQFGAAIDGAKIYEVSTQDGSFKTDPVAQGVWDLAWGSADSMENADVGFTYHLSDLSPVYVATVGPLCPYDFGSIHEIAESAHVGLATHKL